LRTIVGLFGAGGKTAEVAPQGGALPTDVVVEIDSRPRGAVVESVDGRPIGRTPVSVHLARGKAPAAFTLKLSGYEPMRYEVVPERDQMATLELRSAGGF
jgi:hypothetical protein